MKSLLTRNFFTRLFHWEYWPFQLVYLPVWVYGIWCSLRSGSAFFFAASNPGISNGGMFLDPKFPILKLFEKDKIPITYLIHGSQNFSAVEEIFEQSELDFPVIVKPDMGERGLMVEKINSQTELKQYHEKVFFDYLLQEYISYPLEVGVFYYRYPDQEKGLISSVVVKEMLQVKGDGISTVEELMLNYPRASLQVEGFRQREPDLLIKILQKEELLVLESIGNHNRGTTFLDGNHLINQDLLEVIEKLAFQVPGFYYGRFDLKCNSMEELYQGKSIKILELNGAKSEPAHIYQPGFSIFKAYSSIFHHWRVLFRISRMNHKQGFEYPKFSYCL